MESLGTILQRVARGGYSLPPDPAVRYGTPEPAATTEACRRCNGSGYLVGGVHIGDPYSAPPLQVCPCQDTEERRAKRYASLLRYSELPTLHRPSFEDLTPVEGYPNLQHAAGYVEKWCENPAGFLLLMGDVGTGKTHCAVSAGYRLLGQGKTVYFTTAVRLLDTLRDAFRHQDEDGHYALVNKMRTVDVLILDDFGKQRDTDFAQERLATIIDARHAARLITIITTNMTIDELGVWDPATASRLLDRSMSIQVPMHGPDFRRRDK